MARQVFESIDVQGAGTYVSRVLKNKHIILKAYQRAIECTIEISCSYICDRA